MKAFGLPWSAVDLLVYSFILWLFILRALKPLARELPSSCETVGDLTKLVLARNYGTLASRYGCPAESDLLLALRQLIALETGIEMARISPATRIPQDLNIE